MAIVIIKGLAGICKHLLSISNYFYQMDDGFFIIPGEILK